MVHASAAGSYSSTVATGAAIDVAEAPEYVSRGGVKLANALDALGVDVTGASAIDLGASTGGFTDCLLRRGARRVFVLDDDDGALLGDALQQPPGLVLLLGAHPRDRLVEHEQLRVLHEQHADLQPLLLAVGQDARGDVDEIGQADRLQRRGHLRDHFNVFADHLLYLFDVVETRLDASREPAELLLREPPFFASAFRRSDSWISWRASAIRTPGGSSGPP